MNDLNKFQKLIPHFFSFFKEDNILAVSESKDFLPFVFVVIDENYPEYFVLSYTVDYPKADKAAEIALFCTKIRATILTENFYISRSGVTHYGPEANKYFDIDTYLPIEEIEPDNDHVH